MLSIDLNRVRERTKIHYHKSTLIEAIIDTDRVVGKNIVRVVADILQRYRTHKCVSYLESDH